MSGQKDNAVIESLADVLERLIDSRCGPCFRDHLRRLATAYEAEQEDELDNCLDCFGCAISYAVETTIAAAVAVAHAPDPLCRRGA